MSVSLLKGTFFIYYKEYFCRFRTCLKINFKKICSSFTCNFADITARTPNECCWKSRVSKTVPRWAGFRTSNSIFFCRNSFNSLKFPWVDNVRTFITKFSIAAEDILFWFSQFFHFLLFFSLGFYIEMLPGIFKVFNVKCYQIHEKSQKYDLITWAI